jgi:hypothetical protein
MTVGAEEKICKRRATSPACSAHYENLGLRISDSDLIKLQYSVVEPHRPWPGVVFEIEMDCLKFPQFLAWIVAGVDYMRDS